MNAMRGYITLCLISIFALGQVPTPIARERTPGSIRSLPAEIRLDLARRECLIPRYAYNIGEEDQSHAMGHFRSKLTIDYAIVCHIPTRRVQNVLVYSRTNGTWSGEIITNGTYDPSPNADKCETQVDVATPTVIRSYARSFAPVAPEELKLLPRLDHDGVDIGICDKASEIYYFSNGRWLQFQGAD
ncbi:MAG: hypothetical protein ACLQM6_11010 [Acidobacteriaceae bacterium]